MSTYRADPKDGVAWITGGSTGIGRSVARLLAQQGYTVAVTVRPNDPLDTLIAETKDMPGRVLSFPSDVTDEAGMAAAVAAIEAQAGPIVLAVLNAGAYMPVTGDNLCMKAFRQSFAVNVFGVLHGLGPVIDRMRNRGRGHIVFMGSISAYFGWPTTAAYGSTKAAVNIIAEALKFDLDKMNIRTQVMNPGFIDTPLTEKASFSMPAMMPVERAAERICKAIRSSGFEVTFPRRLTWGMKLLFLLPRPIREKALVASTRWKREPLVYLRRNSFD
ncbi:MAG: SDR family NAD(P)-dependent oxidoreductase [Proteobacteria bacterium]|uniref:SDR family NAD(P)-dependent oxidoreductase n=1 Tax=Aminobacter sp. MET-1 TaxID=2951085 RepID=UPI002269E449|nr:SDR family NAD(P)-dependent oxidoreductase [Aminobacter sp. MET-1]MCA0274838.1 SDR family NAD(P)-dependent oxidoreductase [Pseudomonadota bacterium]MCX8568304.1 SDR family NAD(P)-dependent oxidoreductase [Aminobacter sp. MET-1]